MTRQDVYKAIDSERDYQEEMTKNEESAYMINDLHVGDTIAAIQYNLNIATNEWYHGSVPHEGALTYLRKVAALCVYVGEKYGMPER